MCFRSVVWGCVEERLWIWIMLAHVLQSTLHWNTLFGGLATFSASSPGISYSDHFTLPRIIYLPLFKTLKAVAVAVADTQKSEIKVERWKCYLAHSHVWNNNTRMIFLRLSRQPSSGWLAGVVGNIPRNHDNKMTWRCQQEGISKTCHQEIFCPTRMVFRALCRGEDISGQISSIVPSYFQCSHSVQSSSV